MSERSLYLFILDKSDEGREWIERFKRSIEFRMRLGQDDVQQWVSDDQSPYLLLWVQRGGKGGSSLSARGLDDLLDRALPQAMERLRELGGQCDFFCAVTEPVRIAVGWRVALIQMPAEATTLPH